MQEISSDVIRGYNDTIILFFLREEPSYGYEISRNIKTLSEKKEIVIEREARKPQLVPPKKNKGYLR